MHVWGAASAYAMENGLSADETMRVDTVVGYLPERAEGAFCPDSRRKYPDFRLRDGPRCPAGHKTEASIVETLRKRWFSAPTNNVSVPTQDPGNT